MLQAYVGYTQVSGISVKQFNKSTMVNFVAIITECGCIFIPIASYLILVLMVVLNIIIMMMINTDETSQENCTRFLRKFFYSVHCISVYYPRKDNV